MLQQTPLGTDAIDYVKWALTWSQRTLSQYLLALPLADGHAFTFAPPTTDVELLSHFKQGMIGVPGSYEDLIALCLSYLDHSDYRYLIMEDVQAQVGDRWLLGTPTQYVVHGHDAYHFVRGDVATYDAILQAVDNSRGYVTIGVLTEGQDMPVLRNHEQVDIAELKALAAATEYIFIDAYDGEGFVIWKRSA